MYGRFGVATVHGDVAYSTWICSQKVRLLREGIPVVVIAPEDKFVNRVYLGDVLGA